MHTPSFLLRKPAAKKEPKEPKLTKADVERMFQERLAQEREKVHKEPAAKAAAPKAAAKFTSPWFKA